MPIYSLTITRHKCPHCGFCYRDEVFHSRIRLGAKFTQCIRCNAIFRDGNTIGEWPNLDSEQKKQFWTQDWRAFVFFAVVLTAIVLTDKNRGPDDVFIIVSMYTFMVVGTLTSRLAMVLFSISRHRAYMKGTKGARL